MLNDIYVAFQGEGAMTGTPMVIVRLQGCGVGCPWCDTKETWTAEENERVEEIDLARKEKPKWTYADPHEIAFKARDIGPNIKWAMITGGEPAEQDLRDLVDRLHIKGFRAALETSGTAKGMLGCEFDWVCISPKIDMPGGKVLDPYLLRFADEIKQVIASQKDIDNLCELIERTITKRDLVVSLQPVSKNEKATKLCMAACQERGWNLSIQIHRYINAR